MSVSTADPAASGPSRAQQAILGAIALVPLALGAFVWLAAPSFFEPLADGRVSMLGIPLGLWLVALFALVTAVATVIALTVRSAILASLSVVALTGVALYLVMLSPAMVLIAIALGST